MMATVPHVTAWAGRTKYHADGFLLDWVYNRTSKFGDLRTNCLTPCFVSVFEQNKFQHQNARQKIANKYLKMW